MKTIRRESVYKLADGVCGREEVFGLLVVSKTTPALSLNTDSKFVWKLLDGSRSVEGVIKLVREEYCDDDAEEKVKTFLADLLKLDLITEVI
jgi:hypothetical protein